MRLPWVPREFYDAAQRLLVACNTQEIRLTEDLRDARAEIRRLTDILVELKREGFMPPARPEQLVESTLDLPDPVHAAIGMRAPPNSELERELRKWAAQMQRQELAPEAIAKQILRGGHDEEDDGS